MENINFDTSNKTFREILGNGLKYEVPRFQRDYAWTDEQWADLWQDIEEVIQGNNEEHYMGYLVLQRKDTDHSIVIDGQQRLTTVTLIILAGLYHLKALSIEEGEGSENKRRLEALRTSYIGSLDPVSLAVENKLKLNRNNDDYFRTYLIRLDKPKVSRIKRSERQLADACKYFQQKFKNYNGKEVADFINRMASRLLFTTIRVGSDVNAYKVFETLNARGVKLSTPDLLKNFLFSTIDSDQSTHESQLDEIESCWGQILHQLGRNDFSRFILTEWNRRNPIARKNDLFKRIKKSIVRPEDAFQHLRNLHISSEVYTALQDSYDEFWKAHEMGDSVSNLYTLNLFNIVQPQVVLMSAWEKWNQEDFKQLLRIMEVISVRYNVVCQKAARDQEATYNKVAQSIYKGGRLNDVIAELSRVYPADQEFRDAFRTRTFRTRQTSKKARHLLARIERHLSPGQRLDEASFTLEHILPENPEDHWENYFGDTGSIDEYTERLGNMALLTASENRNVKQKDFETKKSFFASSPLLINQKIAEYGEWSKDTIELRQQWLAEQATAVWRVSQFNR